MGQKGSWFSAYVRELADFLSRSLTLYIAFNVLSGATSAQAGKKAKPLKAARDNAYLVKILAS